MLDETRFAQLSAEALAQLESALADLDEVDADLAGDVLTIDLETGAPFIVNRHHAARQVWLAGDGHAWHLDYDEARGEWIDTREGRELFSLIEALLVARLARPVTLRR